MVVGEFKLTVNGKLLMVGQSYVIANACYPFFLLTINF